LDHRVVRTHAADAVFDRLSAMVCGGELPPGATLPTEQKLAERFGVSRPIVRQATHRLAAIGLVRVRQGGATVVADPKLASHPEATAARMRHGGHDARFELHQRQILAPLPMLILAEQYATEEDAAELLAIVDEMARGLPLGDFEEKFWTTVAELTRSDLYRADTAYWFRLVREFPELRHPEIGELEVRVEAYRQLVRRLAAKEDAAQMWLAVARVGLDRLRALRST
jgi:DNA-binding FadR family transcriptional regulator